MVVRVSCIPDSQAQICKLEHVSQPSIIRSLAYLGLSIPASCALCESLPIGADCLCRCLLYIHSFLYQYYNHNSLIHLRTREHSTTQINCVKSVIMKYSAAVLAGAISSVSAASQSYSTIYEYYSDCGSTTTGPASTATGTSTYRIGNVTNIQTDAITICPTCTAKPEIYPEGKTVDLTTYTTIYSCPGVSGLEAKTYTITEPCPTPGVPLPPGHIPQGFSVSTVQCTACPGSPNVPVTGPVAMKTTPPGAPGSPPGSPPGSSPGSPGSPAGGSSPAASPGSSSPGSSPGSPGSPGAAAAPGSPGAGSPAAGSPGSSSPGAPGGGSPAAGSPGSSSPGAPGGGSSSPGSPAGGSSSPGSPAGGSSSPGSPAGAVVPPYPVPGASEARGGAAASGTAAPSGNVLPVTPFKGAATKLFAISLSFVVGVAGFIGLYFI